MTDTMNFHTIELPKPTNPDGTEDTKGTYCEWLGAADDDWPEVQTRVGRNKVRIYIEDNRHTAADAYKLGCTIIAAALKAGHQP